MKRITLAWAAVALLFAVQAAGAQKSNELTPAERSAGWRLLFDGTSLHGWHALGYAHMPDGLWTVRDGAIEKLPTGRMPVQADGQPLESADLISDATYRNFELTFDWKVTPGANSGVKYNVSEELSRKYPPAHAALGFEYQVLDDSLHPDGRQPIHRAAALYDLIAPDASKHLAPVGQWNHSRVVFVGSHGEHWLNGSKVVEYDLASPDFKARFARSKYDTIPGFADRRAGHIVLQNHPGRFTDADNVWFRNIRIRELRERPNR